MSDRKFASITGDLLARKGEAGPSADRFAAAQRWKPEPPPMPREMGTGGVSVAPAVPEAPVSAPVLVRPSVQPQPQSIAAPDHSEPTVKIALKLSEAQHFRMRVAAAQLQVSRQSLMSAALDHYLSTVCAAGLPECKCLGSGKGCACAG